jgi:hypothetical protein
MWFDIPQRKYRHFPTKLVGNHRYRFRNSKGQYVKFRKGARQTLFLEFKKPQLFIDYLLSLQEPATPVKPRRKPSKAVKKTKKAKTPAKTAKKPAKALSRSEKAVNKKIAEAKARIRKLKQWTAAEAVMEDLESRYDNLTYDRQLTGFRFSGKGNYNGTFWPIRAVEPFVANSLFMYVVKDVTGYKGDEPTYVVASMHVKWSGNTDEISSTLLKDYTKERVLLPDGRRVYVTNLQRLMEMLFGKGGGKDSIVEFVGIKFSKARAPKRKHINPPKRKK